MGGVLSTAEIEGIAYVDPGWSQSKADPETAALERFVMGWWNWFKDRPVKVADLYKQGLGVDLTLEIPKGVGTLNQDVAVKRALGLYVNSKRDRYIAGFYIRECDIKTDNVTWWRLERKEEA
jgi:hypothetical protein